MDAEREETDTTEVITARLAQTRFETMKNPLATEFEKAHFIRSVITCDDLVQVHANLNCFKRLGEIIAVIFALFVEAGKGA